MLSKIINSEIDFDPNEWAHISKEGIDFVSSKLKTFYHLFNRIITKGS
jgi:hypothetical protein